MADPPRAVDSGVKESLEGVLEKMDEGCGQDDACAKVLANEEEDAGDPDGAVRSREGWKGDGCS